MDYKEKTIAQLVNECFYKLYRGVGKEKITGQEMALNVKFPSDYADFLNYTNGGDIYGGDICNKKASLFTKRGAGNLLRSVFTFIPMGIAFLALGLTNIILNIGNRGKEYAADAYAVRIGYGNELRRALNSIDLEGKTSRRGFWRVLTAAHPGVYDRIGRIDAALGSTPERTEDLFSLVNS
ncbi:MAG: hypothetical protein E7514_01925 [Ruminococcaceae bacterium]|nr:hypothetical protein [Oscillospiraceae bacterium]